MTDPVTADPAPAEETGPILIRTKLRPPAIRHGLVRRARLDALVAAGLRARLCLVDAPAGFGKTTLLAQWCTAAPDRHRVAWVSLDEADSDPVRFWVYVVEAFRTVAPGVGATALAALHTPGPALMQVVVPRLLNELAAAGGELVLVLDDYHLVTNPTCHDSLVFFVEHLPAGVHVVLSTRADPPLPLGRLRARGELAELRVPDLRFSDAEAAALLHDAMGLQVAADQVQRLTERTEGWAAALYLAGLSLRGRDDADAYIASFAGGHRYLVDFLGGEVLAAQPAEVQTFLLRTSILGHLSGPLCDAVLEREGSAALLRRLEHANLFLVALDDHGEWYRYHHLFAELLRLELATREPELVPVLHRRAAAWHEAAGDIEAAVHHATAAGDHPGAGALIARHWLAYSRRGRLATVTGWLEALPDQAIAADPPLALAAAWVAGLRGAPRGEIERWLEAAERAGGVHEGPLPDDLPSLASAVAVVRAVFPFDDVGRALAAARRAVELADAEPSPSHWMGMAVLGHSLYLSGRSAEARPQLEQLARDVPPAAQPYAVINAFALLSLLAGEQDDGSASARLARRAVELAEAAGLGHVPLCGLAYLALGRALARDGHVDDAEAQLEHALELLASESFLLDYVQALLALAPVRLARGDPGGARKLLEQAHALIQGCADPGMLPSLLEETERALRLTPASRQRRPEPAAPLTERELAVLRLLPTRLSQREIARELYVSVNTTRTHIQGIYRKLGVSSRRDAVAHARELGLVPGSA